MLRALFLIISLIHTFCAQALAQSTLTFSTSYQSPTGQYSSLRLIPQAAPTCSAALIGTLYTDTLGQLFVCTSIGWSNPGNWSSNSFNNNALYPTNFSTARIALGGTDPSLAGATSAKLTLLGADDSIAMTVASAAGIPGFGVSPYSGGGAYLWDYTSSSWVSGMRLHSGNVGINMSPLSKLSIGTTGTIHLGSTACGGNYVGLTIGALPACSTYTLRSSPTSADLDINRPVGNNISFRENNTEQMVIKATSGNVGIGQSTPIAPLHIKGSTQLLIQPSTAAGGEQSAIGFQNTNGSISTSLLISNRTLYFNGPTAGSGAFRYFTKAAPIERLTILGGASGNVGIGNTNPTLYKLQVNGMIWTYGDLYADTVLPYSDRRLKKNIHPLDHVLDHITSLNGVTFTWKKNGDKQIGVIAQDVENVFPELVSTDISGMKSISYTGLIPVLIKAVQEQQKDIDELKEQVRKHAGKQTLSQKHP